MSVLWNLFKSIWKYALKMEKFRNATRRIKRKAGVRWKISSYRQDFNSSEFDKIKKLINLPDSVARNFISAFSMYEGMCGLTEKMDTIEYIQSTISRLYKDFKKRLNGISISVSNILDDASKENVKLEFREKNPIAERLLIIYYSDIYNFDYYRNTIEIEGCKLGKDFMKAYLAEGSSEEKEACAWFMNEAQKYKI